ncbi:MAG: OsmC family protein [Pseudomonadota bacterium]
MSEHRIRLEWAREGAPFERNNYRREHRIIYAGGQAIDASAAPGYGGRESHVDPEQQLLGALSSCHMLTFLAVAANRGYVVDAYEDDAVAMLGRTDTGTTAFTAATLRPRIRFAAPGAPAPEDLAKLHERAHRACFVANSLRTAVTIEPRAA